ncbi:MAG TPA: DUF222 domain-containing protein [Steroidobacteraceae bacterium]|nr:DUF222 domain-containing protein [Steroidobacteraceae bacterium]
MRTIRDLATEICTLAGRINAANHRFLELIAEFDQRKGWWQDGMMSCAHWLNFKCGIAMGAAREKVRVARALETLPKVSAAMQSGALSYSKAREITRVGNEHNEEYLLSIAEHGTAAHVEKLVRAYRRCQEAEELSRDERQQQSRRVTFRHDDDGSLVLTCRLPAEVGARVMKALDVAIESLPVHGGDVPAGTSRPVVPFSQRRADALDVVAGSFLAHKVLESPGTDRHEIVVHVAAETLRSRVAGCCEIEDGPSIAAETARRFACDASLYSVIEDEDGEPLNVGRKTRNISAPLRRLLRARDKGCRFPGCSNSRYIDAHHIKHWANGGETRPANLVSLCRFHHRAVHEGGFDVQILDDGALRFIRPDGRPVMDADPGYTQPRGEVNQMPVATGRSRDCNGRMDLGLAVDILFQRSRPAGNVPAGTSAS